MTDQELAKLISDIETSSNDAIDKLIKIRDSCPQNKKYFYRYSIKKLEVIVGSCHRVQDKLREMELNLND